MTERYEVLSNKIGKIVMGFNHIELLISCIVSRLITDDPKIGAIVISEMSFQNLIKAFDSLIIYKLKDENDIKVIRSVIKKINEIEQVRNVVVHSSYAENDINTSNDLISIKITAKQGKGLKTSSEKINIEKFDSNLKSISTIMIHLNEIHNKLFPNEKMQFA